MKKLLKAHSSYVVLAFSFAVSSTVLANLSATTSNDRKRSKSPRSETKQKKRRRDSIASNNDTGIETSFDSTGNVLVEEPQSSVLDSDVTLNEEMPRKKKHQSSNASTAIHPDRDQPTMFSSDLSDIDETPKADNGFDKLKIPELHQRPLRAPTQEEIENWFALGILMKSGRFSISEDAQIRRNFQSYIADYGGTYNEVFGVGCVGRKVNQKATNNKLAKRFFHARLAHGLPNRHIWHVYLHARKICHPNYENRANGRRRPYTRNELETVASMYSRGQSLADIGQAVKRCPSSLYIRLNRFGELKSEPFNDADYLSLVMCVSDVHNSATLLDARHLLWRDIKWKKVVGLMGNRDYEQCRRAWLDVVLPETHWPTRAQKYFLCCLIRAYANEIENADDLPWDELARDVGLSDGYIARIDFHHQKRNIFGKHYPDIDTSGMSLRKMTRKMVKHLKNCPYRRFRAFESGYHDDIYDVVFHENSDSER